MPECQECGAFVTQRFERVFSGRDGKVHGCYECMDKTAVQNGGATRA